MTQVQFPDSWVGSPFTQVVYDVLSTVSCYSYLVVFTHWRWVFSIKIYLHYDNKTFKIYFIFDNTPLITTILTTIIYSLHMRSLELLNIYTDSFKWFHGNDQYAYTACAECMQMCILRINKSLANTDCCNTHILSIISF